MKLVDAVKVASLAKLNLKKIKKSDINKFIFYALCLDFRAQERVNISVKSSLKSNPH